YWFYHEVGSDSSKNHLLSLSLSLGMNPQHGNPPSNIRSVGSELNFAFKDDHPGQGLNSGKRILESKNDPLRDSPVDINLNQKDLKETVEGSPQAIKKEHDVKLESHVYYNRNWGRVVQEKLENVLYSLWPKLTLLEKSNSSENSLLNFMQHMDSFAENILLSMKPTDNHNSKSFWSENQIKAAKPNTYGSENKLEKILDHKKIPLDKTLVDEWLIKIEHHSNKEFRISALNFIDIFHKQIESNGDEYFYIPNNQIKMFFETKDDKQRKQVLSKLEWPLEEGKEYHRPAYYTSKITTPEIKLIRWKDIFVSDKKIDLNEKRSSIIKNRYFPPWFVNYSSNIRHRDNFRRIFLIYSTMINKIFCEGHSDLTKNFLKRQEEAIEFYDKIWELLKIQDYKNTKKYYSYLFIENKELPIPEERKSHFLQTYNIQERVKAKSEVFEVKTSSEYLYQNSTLWKFIALWLAGKRYDLYKLIFLKEDTKNLRFKPFISTLISLAAYDCHHL
ncbi:expressed protein, partial [Phakopsora pachyrhizi]